MKFIVYTPLYFGISGGINVLFQLAKLLSLHGHDSKIYVARGNVENNIYNNFASLEDVTSETIVIYPEQELGNPLNATIIIRWILYGSHLYDQYDKNEIIYYYAPFSKYNNTTQILNITYLPDGCDNRNEIRELNSCYTLKKGLRYPKIRNMTTYGLEPTEQSLKIEDQNHSEIIDIFNRCKYFICYDPCCFLVIMALLCGCIVIQEPVDEYTEEEWIYAQGIPEKLKGFSYGRNNLHDAESTIHLARQQCLDLIKNKNILKFLDEIKNKSYSTAACFRFNDFSDSMQHFNK